MTGFNLGVKQETQTDEVRKQSLSSFFYTLATGFGLTDRLGAFVELYGDLGLDSAAPDTHSFDGGFTYLLRANLQLDLTIHHSTLLPA